MAGPPGGSPPRGGLASLLHVVGCGRLVGGSELEGLASARVRPLCVSKANVSEVIGRGAGGIAGLIARCVT